VARPLWLRSGRRWAKRSRASSLLEELQR
jgi:hypothetical protein